jgi:tRNA (cytidine32/uridine32-2'-O)-methyltransferase
MRRYNRAMTTSLDHVRIVLVETSHPGNIGGAARAMKTMGLSQLWLVRPSRYPDPQADWRAAGALDVLERAVVVDSIDAAIGDCTYVIGTSTRSRRIPWPLATARDAAGQLRARTDTGPVAILFGRETSGLTNDELQRCNVHLQIPANPDYPSLNVAMAVQVVCYELYQAHAEPTEGAAGWDREPATAAQIEGLLAHLETVLTRVEFVDPANPGQVMTRFRRMLLRIHPDETEVGMVRGALTELERALDRAKSHAQDPHAQEAPHAPHAQGASHAPHVHEASHSPHAQEAPRRGDTGPK